MAGRIEACGDDKVRGDETEAKFVTVYFADNIGGQSDVMAAWRAAAESAIRRGYYNTLPSRTSARRFF